ncbi:hypothetical protein NQ318_019094 [Aromia moschata]|uniref:Uncharacterized protein n=1 Tax=Aromia moschata TaxID=1265417 RepID=A0AAV8Y6A5_9CUCU|nr:hypothetical protein NQ318_019094 [Aromia moschata]
MENNEQLPILDVLVIKNSENKILFIVHAEIKLVLDVRHEKDIGHTTSNKQMRLCENNILLFLDH